MKAITVKEILQETGGRLLQGSTDRSMKGACIDSRQVQPENGFFAMKGEKTDGHAYLGDVLKKGCRILVISDEEKAPDQSVLGEAGLKKEDVSIILVSDTLKALQQLAKYYIAQLPLKKKIAVTGSVGKTSTRDMLYYVASTRYKTGRNEKNYNNEFGLPLTILSFDEDLEVAVLEMGMDSFGEIDTLADIVRPDIAVITTIGISHIENLGSREGIRKAKMEVTGYFTPDSVLVVNQSCDLLQKDMVSGNYRVVTAGNDGKSDFVVSNVCDFGDKGIKYTLDRNHKQYEVALPVPGAHNAMNATLALAAGEILGIDLETAIAGLQNAELTAKRLNIRGKNGIKVIDDTYNAAPESMRSAINTLVATRGIRKVAILSDMKELGPESEKYHREVGAYAGSHRIDFLITVGEQARFIGEGAAPFLGADCVKHYGSRDDLMKEIRQMIRPGDVVLVKGSRAMEMENVVKKIFEEQE
ncbi:MAG: UDP-N-acetylmuramoyl-tripeptide--D-alanyl-D-alanine ligase [Firmicutes bacterium]|nr:UDP-N-acetylmuramoyl-tripeptide--D-alanyl-D-alanine ligase [Bacillota bacterium]MDY5856780.1 UDP-N-acetylmuramoyl-tripeptide--D-alanyl-D-alanine ligase [Anaerovoracaceae bacterium]